MSLVPIYQRYGALIAAVSLAALLTGCAATAPKGPASSSPEASSGQLIQHLETAAQQWMGTPYRYGGTTARGIDCSGLIRRIYAEAFDMNVPRTTHEQQRLGRAVPPKAWQPGDLLFFDTPGKNRHAGIYLREGRFVHASTSEGVMISNLDAPYWQRTYDQSRRVLPGAASSAPSRPAAPAPRSRSGW